MIVALVLLLLGWLIQLALTARVIRAVPALEALPPLGADPGPRRGTSARRSVGSGCGHLGHLANAWLVVSAGLRAWREQGVRVVALPTARVLERAADPIDAVAPRGR